MGVITQELGNKARRFNQSEIKNKSYATSGRKKAGVALALLVAVGLVRSENVRESTSELVSPITRYAGSGFVGVAGGAWGLVTGGADGVSEGFSDTGVSVDVGVEGLGNSGDNTSTDTGPLIIPPQDGDTVPVPTPENSDALITPGSFPVGSFICSGRVTVALTAENPTFGHAVMAASPNAIGVEGYSVIWESALAEAKENDPSFNEKAMPLGTEIPNVPAGCVKP